MIIIVYKYLCVRRNICGYFVPQCKNKQNDTILMLNKSVVRNMFMDVNFNKGRSLLKRGVQHPLISPENNQINM